MAIDKNTENSATRQIDASAAAIFDILSNPERHAETDDSGMVVSADQAERLKAVGDTFTMNMTKEDGDYQTVNEVFAIQQDRVIGWKNVENTTAQVKVGAKWLYELEPIDADNTTVKLTYQRDELEENLLGMTEKFNDDFLAKSLDKLAAAVAGA
ncbi:SRPBCC family protein [Corynebacterium coyleae]|uniref:SRPBCC family protein n=1 Tax=Corynebacterium coyleae TaxID=53374 RepID=UPI00254D0874|nr:SRPBCC family protein [Corynebacterium coyleae]MDK8663920.1 SRPBCC family protein [Corynebacterium coyleae]MDK8706875.1 SRPBCC family protein [Corynebacterium coyleae]MDK8733722.1 SRPBCC family protein [Corynebacterium coyleae]MDK8892918.1 SRPBCC family protein [Corynebacterium coyleae]